MTLPVEATTSSACSSKCSFNPMTNQHTTKRLTNPMNKITTPIVTAVAFCLTIGLFPAVPTSSWLTAGGVVATPAMGCHCRACRGKRHKRNCRKCPKCNQDSCYPTCEKKKVKKTCFEVDQKVVCIPRVTFPWQKCFKGCAKTRTVNVLGVKEYECDECKFTWKLCQPDLPPSVEPGPELPDFEGKPEPKPAPSNNGSSSRQSIPFENNRIFDPTGSDVPTPPTTSRINK